MSSYESMLKQIEELKQKAEVLRKEEMTGAISQIKELMAKYSVSAEDLGFKGGKKAIRARSASVVKHTDPATGKTWSGRGRKPKWFVGA